MLITYPEYLKMLLEIVRTFTNASGKAVIPSGGRLGVFYGISFFLARTCAGVVQEKTAVNFLGLSKRGASVSGLKSLKEEPGTKTAESVKGESGMVGNALKIRRVVVIDCYRMEKGALDCIIPCTLPVSRAESQHLGLSSHLCSEELLPLDISRPVEFSLHSKTVICFGAYTDSPCRFWTKTILTLLPLLLL